MRAIRSISAALNRRVTAADPVAIVRPSTPEFPWLPQRSGFRFQRCLGLSHDHIPAISRSLRPDWHI
jgi:hypothetical protein